MNLTELAEQIANVENQWGQGQLAIWGGICADTDVLTLLKDWPDRDKAMPYRIWEFSDKICFEEKTLPDDHKWLERGQLFGPGGDLTVRREYNCPVRKDDATVEYIENCFRWRFVGQFGTKPPTGEFNATNFWDHAEPDTTFHHYHNKAMLWGERREGFDLWFEDRVGPNGLKYPSEKLGRVRVEYQTFSRAGKVEFVWFLGLEDDNG